MNVQKIRQQKGRVIFTVRDDGRAYDLIIVQRKPGHADINRGTRFYVEAGSIREANDALKLLGPLIQAVTLSPKDPGARFDQNAGCFISRSTWFYRSEPCDVWIDRNYN